MIALRTTVAWSLAISCAIGAPSPFPLQTSNKPNSPQRASDLRVDVGYAIYEGYRSESTGLNIWKGIRYAAAPIGPLRWKSPTTPPPSRNHTAILPATAYGSSCPQSYVSVPGAPFVPGDEDCLFLNVWSPTASANGTKKSTGQRKGNDTGLPVLVWIHGGGYGLGDSKMDMSELIQANDGKFLVVSIQYRLGAFGFLSSAEVQKKGISNAGIADMLFALKWVQKHISKFGGDRQKVTISGESAGGGAVMLLAMAYGGTLGKSLFRGGIAASPYLPLQYSFNASVPTARYTDFAQEAGCANATNVFACLQNSDSMVLQKASDKVSKSQFYGTWGFLPVTDGKIVKELPSAQLAEKKVNGAHILVGNNANEGPPFVPQTIQTLSDLTAWVTGSFPSLSPPQIQQVLNAYQASSDAINSTSPRFETSGLGPATAVNVSQAATGQQQRAYNMYAEAIFVCPSYWLSSAYANSYHYQYSIPFASHGADVSGIFGPASQNQGPEFVAAFRKIWGSYVVDGVPQVYMSFAELKNEKRQNLPPSTSVPFPLWSPPDFNSNPELVNLNQTGGVPYDVVVAGDAHGIQFSGPGLMTDFSVVDAWDWEGGRGRRCDFWRGLGAAVPM